MNYRIKSLVYLICFAVTALTYYVLDNERPSNSTEIVQTDLNTISTQNVN